MNRKEKQNLKSLMPWYITGKLPEDERDAMEEYLRKDTAARLEVRAWEQVQGALKSRPSVTPSLDVRRQILSYAHLATPIHRPSPFLQSLAFSSIALSLLIFLWMLIKPGVVLQWSTSDNELTAFRIYRAPAGSEAFTLVREISTSQNMAEYSFVDAFLLPGQVFEYRVEGWNPVGGYSNSQSVTGRALDALPAQVAVLLTSLILAFFIVYIAVHWPIAPGNRKRLIPI